MKIIYECKKHDVLFAGGFKDEIFHEIYPQIRSTDFNKFDTSNGKFFDVVKEVIITKNKDIIYKNIFPSIYLILRYDEDYSKIYRDFRDSLNVYSNYFNYF